MDSILKAHTLKKELDKLRPLNKEQEYFIMQKFRLDWNYHSNNLEGNSLTYGETKALLLHHITAQGKPLKDHVEITGHNDAILWIEEVVKNEKPLTEQFIRELHQLLLKEPYQVDAVTIDGTPTKKWIKVGQYKDTPNHVKTITGEIFHFATPEETPAEMEALMNWYRSKCEDEDAEPIIIAAEFHYRFIKIHPFDDGNGRVARILMNFILMRYGYPPVIIKTEDKSQYISALQQADANINEPFFDFIATNLRRSLELMLRGARGESIEEPDDIDKKISLLDSKFRNYAPKIEKIKSQESIEAFIKDNLSQYLKSFLETITIFEKFFIRNLSEFKLVGGDWKEVKPQVLWVTAGDILITHKDKIADEVIFKNTFTEMRYLGFENVQLEFNFGVRFNRSTVTIKTNVFEKDYLYTDSPTSEELNLFKRSLKSFGNDFLENALSSKKNDELI